MSGLTAWWGQQARPQTTVAASSDLATLLTAIVGGTSAVKALYAGGVNVTSSGGLLQTWDDARGASGFGPQLVGFGATKPAYSTVTKTITTSGSNWVQSTKNAAFNLATDGTIVAVAALPTGVFFPISLADDPYTNPIGLTAIASDSPGWTLSSGPPGVLAPVGDATTLRLVSVGRHNTNPTSPGLPHQTAQVWGRVRTFLSGTSTYTTGTRALCLGGAPNSGALAFGAAIKVQFVMVLDHQLTAAEETAIRTYLAALGLAPVYDNSAPAVVCEGNSRTWGTGSTTPGGATAYPARLKAMNAALSTYDVGNFGIPSQRGNQIVSTQSTRTLPIYNAARSRNFYVYWEMNNDETIGTGVAEAQTATQAACTAAKAAGFRVLVCTELRFSTSTAGLETDRQTYNAWLAANAVSGGWADAVVDLAAIASLDAPHPDTGTNTFYNADKIHLLDAGNDLVATAVYNAMVAYL